MLPVGGTVVLKHIRILYLYTINLVGEIKIENFDTKIARNGQLRESNNRVL